MSKKILKKACNIIFIRYSHFCKVIRNKPYKKDGVLDHLASQISLRGHRRFSRRGLGLQIQPFLY